jgi:CTP synthase (UTP-ammonia lyase)
VLDIAEAEHEESAPDATMLLINRLACSLVGTRQSIMLTPGTLAQRLYGQSAVTEEFACNFGLNPAYQARFANSGLTIAGADDSGDVRLVELPGHPFFLATLYLPQINSSAEQPHPLICGYLRAVRQQL